MTHDHDTGAPPSSAIGYLAFQANGLNGQHWHTINTVLQVDLLGTYGTLAPSHSKQLEIAKWQSIGARQVLDLLPLPEGKYGFTNCYTTARGTAARTLQRAFGLPGIDTDPHACPAHQRQRVAEFLADDATEHIATAVSYAIAKKKHDDAARAWARRDELALTVPTTGHWTFPTEPEKPFKKP